MKSVYRNQRLLETLRDFPCMGCGAEDGTVVAAHRNQGKGMGIKVSDALVAALCMRCHYQLDQGKEMSKDERRNFWNESYIKTIQHAIERNIIVLSK